MNDECISDFAIDGYLAGELDDARRTSLERHVAECARCQTRLSNLREDALAVREGLADLPLQKAPAISWPLLFAVAAGLVLAVALARPWGASERASVDTSEAVAVTRTKGRAHLTTYLRRDARVRVFEGEPVHAGDELAFAYTSASDVELAVFDVEHGVATKIFPEGARTFTAAAGVNVELDVAVALDGSLSEESIVAVFCAQPQELGALADALGEQTDLPQGCRAAWTELPKGAG